MPVPGELEEKVRERGVRVRERLALLRTLDEDGGDEQIRRRVAELEERIRTAAARVREALR